MGPRRLVKRRTTMVRGGMLFTILLELVVRRLDLSGCRWVGLVEDTEGTIPRIGCTRGTEEAGFRTVSFPLSNHRDLGSQESFVGEWRPIKSIGVEIAHGAQFGDVGHWSRDTVKVVGSSIGKKPTNHTMVTTVDTLIFSMEVDVMFLVHTRLRSENIDVTGIVHRRLLLVVPEVMDGTSTRCPRQGFSTGQIVLVLTKRFGVNGSGPMEPSTGFGERMFRSRFALGL